MLRSQFLFYRDMYDEKVRETLEGVDELLVAAQKEPLTELYAIDIAQAVAIVDTLQDFDLIDDDTARGYVDRVNGVVALFRMGLLVAKPAKGITTYFKPLTTIK